MITYFTDKYVKKNKLWHNIDDIKKQSDIIIIVGGITMNYKVDKLDKMQELYNLKKSYSKTNQKSYTKLTDALMITNDRLNTLVITFGVIICTIFITIITK